MKKSLFFATCALLTGVLCLISCNKIDVNEDVSGVEADNIFTLASATSSTKQPQATIKGQFKITEGVSKAYILVSTNKGIEADTKDAIRVDVPIESEFTVEVPDLKGLTTYYCRLFATYKRNVLKSREVAFNVGSFPIEKIEIDYYGIFGDNLDFIAINGGEVADLPPLKITPAYTTDPVPVWKIQSGDVVTLTSDGKIKAGSSAGMATLRASKSGSSDKYAEFKVYVRSQQAAQLVGENFVDLGLSCFWAVRNVGASPHYVPSPGNYFAWGETTQKGTYTLDSYRESAWYENKKNDLVFLPAEYDAAFVANSSNVNIRMPDVRDVALLCRACKFQDAYVDGVKYMKAVSKVNGNSINIPISGFYDGTEQKDKYECYFWTGSYDGPKQDYYYMTSVMYEPFRFRLQYTSGTVGCFGATHQIYKSHYLGLPVRATAK